MTQAEHPEAAGPACGRDAPRRETVYAAVKLKRSAGQLSDFNYNRNTVGHSAGKLFPSHGEMFLFMFESVLQLQL